MGFRHKRIPRKKALLLLRPPFKHWSQRTWPNTVTERGSLASHLKGFDGEKIWKLLKTRKWWTMWPFLLALRYCLSKGICGIVDGGDGFHGCGVSSSAATEDAKDALQTLKIMKEIGPPVVMRMLKILGAANDLIQPLQLARRVKYQLNIINKAREYTSSKVPILTGRTLMEESVAKIEHRNQANFSSDITVKVGEAGSVSLTASEKQPVGYMRSVLESARQHAGNIGWPGNATNIERSSSGTLIGSVHSKPISYMRAVFDTAFQKAELVTNETSGQNEMSVNTLEEIQSTVVLPSEDTYKQFQVEHIPKLEAWLEDSDTATN